MPKLAENIKKEIEGDRPEVKAPDYSQQEIQYLSFMRRRLKDSKEMRDREYEWFDDMNYERWYDKNRRNANAYRKPRQNDDEVRIVTGTTESKVHTVLSALLNFELKPKIDAYNKQDFKLQELGDTMEDLVDKSLDLEDYDKKKILIYKEALDHGDAFVEEIWNERQKVEKTLKENVDFSDGVDPEKIDWDTKLEKMLGKAERNLINGKNFFFGNIKMFSMKKQPYIFTREEMPRMKAERIYGNWARWKHVPYRSQFKDEVDITDEMWRLEDFEQDYVEIIKYQDKWANDYQIMINGVMMLPIGFPLSEISGEQQYTVTKFSAEPMSKFFAYSKSIPAKTRVKQEVIDEFLRLFVLKEQQSVKPAIANNSGRSLSQDIFAPGHIADDVIADDVEPLVDDNGITSSEFKTYELLKKEISEKSVSDVFQGIAPDKRASATQIVEQKKQSMMKLGLVINGAVNFERKAASKRVNTIIKHWTEPIDEKVVDDQLVDVFRTISIDTFNSSGESIERKVEFRTDSPTDEQLLKEARRKSRAEGRKIEKTAVNPELLREKDIRFEFTVTPTEKDQSALEREILIQDISTLQKIFEPRGHQLNYEYWKGELGKTMERDPDKMFADNSGGGPFGGGQPQQAPKSQGGNDNDQGLLENARPSLNNLSV